MYRIEETEPYHNSKGDIADWFNDSGICMLQYMPANIVSPVL
jgi:hypothetical protein